MSNVIRNIGNLFTILDLSGFKDVVVDLLVKNKYGHDIVVFSSSPQIVQSVFANTTFRNVTLVPNNDSCLVEILI